MERLSNVHPGEILLEDFLKPAGITVYRLAKDIDVPQSRIAAIIARERGITVDTARRLGRYFGTTAELWLNLQNSYDLEEAKNLAGDADLEKIRPRELVAA